MHPKEVDRSSTRRAEPSTTALPDGPPALDLAQIERIEGAMEHAAEGTLRAAFDRFFDAWFDRVYAFAWQLGRDTSHAETLTTLAFMKALRLLPRGSKGARELAHRLASERSRQPVGEATGGGPAPECLAVRRNGRAP